MCGITGLIDSRRTASEQDLLALCMAMTNALAHRGPDGEGFWVDPSAGVALGHRRLAIIDLSSAGQQPMVSQDKRLIISYNGEIYNAMDLRAQLEAKGRVFRGHSDTEVIAEGCALWGVADCVERLNGMFAFAVWDRERRSLSLVRDRAGIKPLYWGQFGKLFLFGSELGALRAHPGWPVEIDRDALVGYMRHGCVGGPRSIYRGIQKLQPGHILTFEAGGRISNDCYWDIRTIARRPTQSHSAAIVDQLEALLKDAVRRCMVSDVPLGAFLSGGIDSSTVVALMQSASRRPIKTITIGFDDENFNEANDAKAVAAHLGTDHTELYVETHHLLDIVPKINQSFDEPFADPSQIPTQLLATLTRQQVTVALSGDGGDELFGGYTRYLQARRLWSVFRCLPQQLRPLLGRGILRLSPSTSTTDPGVPWLKSLRLRDRMHRLGDFLVAGDTTALYRQLMSHWLRPEELVLDADEPRGPIWDSSIADNLPDLMNHVRVIDFLTYLPDYVLTKVDRNTMSVGLEARVPLLDHRVVEFAWSLPPTIHVHDGRGKWLLREVLDRYVPRHLIERPKRGFIPPLGKWLSGPLRNWAEALLDEHRLAQQGILNPEPVLARWREHINGRADWSTLLWHVLAFQAWLDDQGSSASHKPRDVFPHITNAAEETSSFRVSSVR